MLQQILRAMASGEATTQRDLAQELRVPEPLISQMVDQLVDQGYLREGDECAVACDSCAARSACGALESLRVWTLTEKGWRAVRR
jgi:DNA-binding IclR family transcriptional regulator